jgi:hypothetical protein
MSLPLVRTLLLWTNGAQVKSVRLTNIYIYKTSLGKRQALDTSALLARVRTRRQDLRRQLYIGWRATNLKPALKAMDIFSAVDERDVRSAARACRAARA